MQHLPQPLATSARCYGNGREFHCHTRQQAADSAAPATAQRARHRTGSAANPGGGRQGLRARTGPVCGWMCLGLGPGIGNNRVAKAPSCAGLGLGLGLAPSAPGAARRHRCARDAAPPARPPLYRPAPGLLCPHMPSEGEEEDGV